MKSSTSPSVQEYLDNLPDDRRAVVSSVRDFVLEHLPDGYRESVAWGMITYCIPLEVFPDTYNKQPLGYIALAAQKNHYALYLMGVYADSELDRELREGYEKAGLKLDMGKSCLRFKKLEQLERNVLAKIIASTPPEDLIALHEAVHAPRRKKG